MGTQSGKVMQHPLEAKHGLSAYELLVRAITIIEAFLITMIEGDMVA